MHIIRTKPTPEQTEDMLRLLRPRIKLAVDLERRVVAGGGALHSDCLEALVRDGSRREDVWGASWFPADGSVLIESMINVRPAQGNRSTAIEDAGLRGAVEAVVRERMESSR